jgi:hypothetical protein
MDWLVIVLLFGLVPGVGGLITGLVLRKLAPQMRSGGIAILALGWAVAGVAAILAYDLLWNAPVWLGPIVFGAVFGIIGGGVTLWQAKRGPETAPAAE